MGSNSNSIGGSWLAALALSGCAGVGVSGTPGEVDALDPDAGVTEPAPQGLVFYGEFRADPGEGIRVCDYPARLRCTTDAEGPFAGRSRTYASQLPPRAELHHLRFEFESDGYLTNNTAARFAVGVRGATISDGEGAASVVNGRGFVIGNLGGEPRNQGNPACGPRVIQSSSFQGDAHAANPEVPADAPFPDTCSDTVLREGVRYTLDLYVSSTGRVGYKLHDDESRLVHAVLFQDPADFVPRGLTDVFFRHDSDTEVADPSGNWRFMVDRIALASSDERIEDKFAEPVMEFARGSTPLSDDALVSTDEIAGEPGVSVGTFSPSRTRMFGCVGRDADFDTSGCHDPANYRIIDFADDPAFTYDGSRLHFEPNSLDEFPPDTYKLAVRPNPHSSLVEATLRIIKPGP